LRSTPASPTSREQATAALALATVTPDRAVSDGLAAETAAGLVGDWSAVSVARRARGVAHMQLGHLDDAVSDLRAAIDAARRARADDLAGEARMSLGPAL